MPKVSILGVKFDAITFQNALKKAEQFLESSEFHYIVTPNPEFLVKARSDKNFHQILNEADLSLPDGTGIILAAKLKNLSLKEKIPGTDFLIHLFPILQKNGYKIYLLGGKSGLARKTKAILEDKYPGIKIVGAESGPSFRSEDTLAAPTQELLPLVTRIKESGADILVVAFGAPKQEKFIYRYKGYLGVKTAIGVGGALDYISGDVQRAPAWLRKIGLEWLYRLIKQPSRLKRVLKAVFIFPLLFIFTDEDKKS